MPYQEEFLAEEIRQEGQGDAADLAKCPSCEDKGRESVNEPIYQCDDCFGGFMECATCCLEWHGHVPLHHIKKWTSTHFEKVALKDLGLRIQLGHTNMECVNPEAGTKKFTVIHMNGIHIVNVNFCNSTVDYPETSASIEVLNAFHILTLGSKMTLWAYYRSLEHMMDNLDIDTRYRAFMRMVHQYRSVKMSKRSGCGNVVGGITETSTGELAIQCFACPQPNFNLPDNWESADPDKAFLYALLVSLDANFCLKNCLKSSEGVDPGLNTRKAYFVNQEPYNAHLQKFGIQKELSTCSGFKALVFADSKFSTSLHFTGVGMCVCAWHELVRPGGVRNLQKACQYKVNFQSRMAELPLKMQLSLKVQIDWGIPKCHCPAHKIECQLPHSMNLKPGVGRTDSEGIERDWAAINPVASSTKEMGPGSHHNTLDDHFGHHNWQKTTNFGHTLRCKLCLAAAESLRQSKLFAELSDSVDGLGTIQSWKAMIEKWEQDHTTANPYIYVLQVNHATQHQVRQKLLETTGFMTEALSIEDAQRKILHDLRNADLTPLKASQMEECHIAVRKHIHTLCRIQLSLMPGINNILTSEALGMESVEAESVCLWLPLSVATEDQKSVCIEGLAEKEERLREAQCHDLLEKICALQTLKSSDLVPPVAFDINDTADHIGSNRHARSAKQMKDMAKHLREEYRQVSWIWSMDGVLGDGKDSELNNVICWKADSWWKLGEENLGQTPAQAEGAHAYALRQASIFDKLWNHFTMLWSQPLHQGSSLWAHQKDWALAAMNAAHTTEISVSTATTPRTDEEWPGAAEHHADDDDNNDESDG
ncbi:hypothetical protein BDN71DRAFT_1481675 [Pleurotus eryngii]|uniref:CxC2-like cysteine cluster KDZ transposase-associated domain-containing protein n=1 Tax=Pleurotus eryngii TaxID=5323 RepID=A0A9P6A438_PLEER|nr:hypothetical protein BDN71DRAFT_1481675 [Pleurotus eryngii]